MWILKLKTFWCQEAWVQIPTLPTTSRMILSKSLNLSKSQFPSTCLTHHKCSVKVVHYFLIHEPSQLLQWLWRQDFTPLGITKGTPKIFQSDSWEGKECASITWHVRRRAGAGTRASGPQSNNFTAARCLLSQMSHPAEFQAGSQHAFLPQSVIFNRGFQKKYMLRGLQRGWDFGEL